jgi:hypothetical protein
MFRAAAITAVIEMLLCFVLLLVSMAKAGQGSGVFIVLFPFIWLVLALRLWVGLAVASALAPDGAAHFLVAAGAVGLLSTVFVVLILYGNVKEWSSMWVFAPSIFAHIVAAILVLRTPVAAGVNHES